MTLIHENGTYYFSPSELRTTLGDVLDFNLPPDVPALQGWQSVHPCLANEPSNAPQYLAVQPEDNNQVVRVQVNSSDDYYFSPAGLPLCGSGDLFTLLAGREHSATVDSTTTLALKLTSTLFETTTTSFPGRVSGPGLASSTHFDPVATTSAQLHSILPTVSSTSVAWEHGFQGNYTGGWGRNLSYWGSGTGLHLTKTPSAYPPVSSSLGFRAWPSRLCVLAICYAGLYSLV